MNWSPVTYPSPARTASRTNSFSAPATPIVGLGIASIHYPSTLVDRRLPATPQPSYLSDSWICAPAQEPSDLAVPKVECKDYLWATNSQDDFVYWSTPFEIEHYQHAVEVFHSHGPMMQQSHVKSQDYHEQRLSHRNKIGHESRSVESHYQQHIPVKQESSLDWTPTSMDNYPTHLSYQDLPSSQVEVLEPAINMSHSLLPPPTNQILPSTAATQTRATPHSSGRQEARQGTRQERLPHFDSEQIQNNSEAPSDTTQGSGSQASRREPKDKRFKCSICGRGFARKFNCTQHEKKHSNERREPSQACHYLNCDKTFGRKTDLDRHINSVSQTCFAACHSLSRIGTH